jgi:antitoxin (DNA-binding transcriptional repressor) of toxin-antitoxin stability system
MTSSGMEFGFFVVKYDHGHDYGHNFRRHSMILTISKSKLKAKMLEIFRQLEASGDELIVTDQGKPVLKIIPIRQKSSVKELFAESQGQVTYQEDINTPSLQEWDEV